MITGAVPGTPGYFTPLPIVGSGWHDTTTGLLAVWDGTQWVSDALLVKVPPVTGVVAGTPGYFTPVDRDIPADLAALQDLGALGQTDAWTVGQYVVLGDDSEAHWDGDSWEEGRDTLIVYDTFTDDDETLLINHTPETGGAWIASYEPTATIGIRNNEARYLAAGANHGQVAIAVGVDSYNARLQYNCNGSDSTRQARLIVRSALDARDCFWCQAHYGQGELRITELPSATVRASAAMTINEVGIIECDNTPSRVTAKHNGTEISYDSTALNTKLNVGMAWFNTGHDVTYQEITAHITS